MDPRQPPQHPFSRNTASPYGRTPFPPSANQAPFPPSSHPPNAAPTYAEHQRRPSEPPYYPPQRSYGQEGPPIGGPGHSRHQSASSIGGRGMPPPSSPQSQHHGYGPPPPPPPPRGPPVSVGPPSAFTSGRDLPTLPPIGGRLQTSGMSISSMLGGPPSTRETPPSQYGSPILTAGGQVFPGAPHASPRMSAASDYAPFRRPQTPEHRPYEPRDHRANSAGSPPGMGSYSTPETRARFGTPGRQGMPMAEERREPIRVPNPNAIPARPSSQPNYNVPGAPPQRRVENPRNPPYQEGIFGRRPDIDQRSLQEARLVDREKDRDRQLLMDLEREREHRERERERELREREQRERERERLEPSYQRAGYEDRHTAYGYAERERQEREREREVAIQRELEIRERELRERERAIAEHAVQQQDYAHQLAQRKYNRPPEPREQPSWMRPEPPRPAYDQAPERPPPQQERPPNGYEYPVSAAPQYRDHPAYAPSEPRYPAAPHPTSAPPQHNAATAPPFETYLERDQRAQAQLHQQQQQQQQSIFGGPSQNVPYQAQDSPRRRDLDDPQLMQRSRSLLGVQEINRKGRVSPLPQAVQGAQGQIGGGGEPSIKSEFGRMFSGIGSGVGAMGIQSPVTAGTPALSFSGQLHREDVENMPGQDSPMENGGNKLIRSVSRGGGSSRRRKLKEEDIGGDDSSTGRRTPSIRGKRSKTHHHHHHHHHHHADNSSPLQTPFKNPTKASSVIPSPPDQENKTPILHHHHIPASRVPHHHHHHKPSSPKPTIPLPVRTIKNEAVLASVADKPRRHLGHAYYSSELAPTSSNSASNTSTRGFVSTANPLPKFEGKENCTFTVKIPAMYLQDTARRDITYRRAVWGTDIYTDDSDVLCACIHSGYVQGCFNPDIGDEVGLKMLLGEDCVLPPIGDLISEPPKTGPSLVPEGKELHVTVLILPPLLEYKGMHRFGVKSRAFGEGGRGHDGGSFMVTGVKWVSGSSAQNSKPNSKNNTIMPGQLSQQELEEEATFARLFNGDPVNSYADPEIPESNVRSEVRVSRSGEITGLGMGSWWKKAARMETGQDGEKRNGVGNGTGQDKGTGKGKERSVDILAEAAASLPPLETTTSTSTSITPQNAVEKVTETIVENVTPGEGDAAGGVEHVKNEKEGVGESGVAA
ncbi:hypothetical protein LOCC1_G003690 [Lachnellula occidentalis]|uniref:Histone deacetylation protein Rxt3 n=1 Tax=Lachnellula occidentalis TaxID=215460 RepID=A0A8H8S5Y3_9HELO|nr:hypothetical protein LOCC1_G003690 [Lachnellula occidentalis]